MFPNAYIVRLLYHFVAEGRVGTALLSYRILKVTGLDGRR